MSRRHTPKKPEQATPIRSSSTITLCPVFFLSVLSFSSFFPFFLFSYFPIFLLCFLASHRSAAHRKQAKVCFFSKTNPTPIPTPYQPPRKAMYVCIYVARRIEHPHAKEKETCETLMLHTCNLCTYVPYTALVSSCLL